MIFLIIEYTVSILKLDLLHKNPKLMKYSLNPLISD